MTDGLISVPIGVAAPPECPWLFGGSVDVLVPSVPIPQNASFWIRDYRPEPTTYAVIDQTTGSTIAIDQLEIDLTATGGRLIQLRPRLPLAPLRTYEIDLGGTATHVCLESATSATILRKSTGSPDIAHLPVTELRPNLLMVAWQDADRTTTVHVYDFDSGEAHAVVGHGERRVRRARGTVRPAPTTNAPS